MRFATLTGFADRIDRLNTAMGRAVAWLALAVVLLEFALVVARYRVRRSARSGLTETVIYAHATLFMLAAAWTLRAGGHVRVDVFYAEASPRAKAIIDLVGALLLLLPFAAGADLAERALRGALLGDPRALAGDERPAAGVRAQDTDPVVRRADGAARHRAGDQGAGRAVEAALMPLAEVLAILMVAAVIAALMAGYPVALTLAGVSLIFAVLGHVLGVMGLRHSRRAAAAHLRRDDQRDAAGDPDVHLHGRDARALARRRGIAGDHGPAVRHAARRARHLGDRRRHAARRGERRRRRHHRDHGPDRAAGDAALRLRPAACRRHRRRHRDAGADLPARHRAGAARRPARQLPTRRRSSRRETSRRVRSPSAICSPARCCPALRWSRSISST